jgi:L-ascorbate metabolism protein UlaG (beta-lactamase superfamily)
MEPREAAVAARLLGARLVVPIHYGPLHEAPNYIQVDDPAGTVLAAAEDLGVAAKLMRPGEMLNLEPTSTAT